MKKPRPALFSGYLLDNGTRRRATRAELREATRLWYRHSDIREGRTKEQQAARKATA